MESQINESFKKSFFKRGKEPINQQKTQNDQGQVQKYTEGWRIVEFHLKSAVNYEIEIKKILTIFNQHMEINFNKKSKDKLTAYAWIKLSSSESTGENSINKLRSRGFEIPERGLDFIVGSLFNEDDEDYIEEIDSYFILCKIIIGRSYCKIVQNKSLNSTMTNFQIPPEEILSKGYESIMFCPADNNFSKQKNFGLGNKTFRYRIFDSSNVLPMYYVWFIPYSQFSNTIPSKKFCENCEVKDAEYYCFNDKVNLCAECWNSIHGNETKKNNVFANHKKIELNANKTRPGKCFYDQEKDAEFYCLECNLPICSYCRVIGSHSKNEERGHKLEEIVVTYKNSDPNSNSNHIKSCEDKKKEASAHISSIKEKVETLHNVIHQEAEKALENEFKKEYDEIQKLSINCLQSYITTTRDLLIIKDMVNNLDEYFKKRESYIKDNIPEYVWTFFLHKDFVEDIMKNRKNVEYQIVDENFDKREINNFSITHFKIEDSTVQEKKKDDNFKKNSEQKKQVFEDDLKSYSKNVITHKDNLREYTKKSQSQKENSQYKNDDNNDEQQN